MNSESIIESNSSAVDAFFDKLEHPLKASGEDLRRLILDAHEQAGEDIFWNEPALKYLGHKSAFPNKDGSISKSSG